jgi:hypothetical protein
MVRDSLTVFPGLERFDILQPAYHGPDHLHFWSIGWRAFFFWS